MTWPELIQLFELIDWTSLEFNKTYNAAPTQCLPIVVEGRRGELLPCGFPSARGPIINARSETVDTLPTFRTSFRTRRCLVPADGFFEWKKIGRDKQLYFVGLQDGAPFAMAGIYHPAGFTILTTTANELLKPLHDRMPVILRPEQFSVWLGEPDKNLLRTFPANQLKMWPVSRKVNRVTNNEPSLLKPVAEERELF